MQLQQSVSVAFERVMGGSAPCSFYCIASVCMLGPSAFLSFYILLSLWLAAAHCVFLGIGGFVDVVLGVTQLHRASCG